MEEKQTTHSPAWKMLTPIWSEIQVPSMLKVKSLPVKVVTRAMLTQTDSAFIPNCGAKRNLSKPEATVYLKALDLKTSLLENVVAVTQLVASVTSQDQIVLVVDSQKLALTTHTVSALHQT